MQFLSYLWLQLLLLLLAFLPIVARALSQSEDRIGTQLIFPNSALTPLKPKKVCSCHQPAYYYYYFVSWFPPKEGHQDKLILESLLSFPLFPACKGLVLGCRLEKAPSTSGIRTNWGSSIAGNKTSQKNRFSAVCMAFPLQFAIIWLQRRVLQVPTFRALYRKVFVLSFHQILSQTALQQLVKGREAFYYSDSLKAATPWKMQDSYRCWKVFLLSPFLASVSQFNTSSQPWFSIIIVSILPFECKKMHLLVCLEAEPGNIVSHLATL